MNGNCDFEESKSREKNVPTDAASSADFMGGVGFMIGDVSGLGFGIGDEGGTGTI